MKIGIPNEVSVDEARVALIPRDVAIITKHNHEVLLEKGAGEGSKFSDSDYSKSGAKIVEDRTSIYELSDVLLKVNPADTQEAEKLRQGTTYIGYLTPLTNTETIRVFVKNRILSFSMEFIPRITRAQSMDALSSTATVAGYKAVIVAAERLGKMFPLLMTAAGTIIPADLLVLGVGVAGLQAIATGKRLGARVEAFDPRPAVKEQVKSLGASFLEMDMPEDVETEGGYAKMLSQEFLEKERETISSRLPKVDVVICAAQVFGGRAPVLITSEMTQVMRSGSVIVDLAAEQGGNCELTEAGKTVVKDGITVVGVHNLATTVPIHASQMYSKNLLSLLQQLYPEGRDAIDFEDEIAKGACITRDGEIKNERVKNLLQRGK